MDCIHVILKIRFCRNKLPCSNISYQMVWSSWAKYLDPLVSEARTLDNSTFFNLVPEVAEVLFELPKCDVGLCRKMNEQTQTSTTCTGACQPSFGRVL